VDTYDEGDVVEGRVTKVVTFGAFVEILPGVEGLVHISELAQHHVENPREVVQQGQPVNVLILEIDADRRRLSLSLKRVEEGAVPKPRADGAESVHATASLGLSEDVFAEDGSAAADDESDLTEAEEEPVADGQAEPLGEEEPVEAPQADEPVVETEQADEPLAETERTDEPVAEAQAEPLGEEEIAPEPQTEALGAEEISPEAQAAEDLSVALGAAPEPEAEAEADTAPEPAAEEPEPGEER
jgi:small subunit ribosomal protein S1